MTRKLRLWTLWAILSASALLGSQAVSAQSPCRFTGSFSEVPLSQVLDALASSCGLQLSYDAAFAARQQVHNLEFKGSSFSEVFEAIERQCSVRFTEINETAYAVHIAAPSPGNVLFSLHGTVLDAESGSALPGAIVYLPGTQQGTLTDSEGNFMLETSAAQGLLTISYLGYFKDSISYSKGQLKRTEFALRMIPIEVHGLLVTEESELVFRNGSQGVAMSPRQLDAVAVLGEPDVFRTLQWLPGVSATEESSNGLFIRGGTPDQNLVLIDGIPIYNTGHFFGMFHAFNADALNRVNIQRSGFSAEYGGATAGLLAIDTKPRQLDSLEASINLNLAATSAFVSLPLAKHKVGLMIAGRRSFNDVVRSPLYQKIAGNVFQTGSIFRDTNTSADPEEDYTVDPLSNFHDLHLKMTAKLGSRDDIAISAYNGSDNVSYYFAIKDPDSAGARVGNEYLRLSNYAIGARWNHRFSGRLNLLTSANYSAYRGDFANEHSIEEPQDTIFYNSSQYNGVQTTSLKSSLDWQITQKNRLKAGLQVTNLASEFSLNTSDEIYKWLDSISLIGVAASAFAQYDYHPVEKLKLQPSIRSTWYSKDTEFFLEPRLNLRYEIARGLRLTGNAGYYRQLLSPITVNNSLKLGTEFLTLASKSDGLAPTRALQTAVGLSYLAPGIWASAEIYAKQLWGLQRYTRRFDQEINANEIEDLLSDGTGTVRGIDLFVRGQRGPWSGWVAYTLSQVNHQFGELNKGKIFPADHDHRHELKLVNVLHVDSWEFSLTWILASGKPYSQAIGIDSLVDGQGQPFFELSYDELNSARLPGYHRLDLNVTYSRALNSRIRLRTGLSIFNLYDRKNIRDRNYSLDYDFSLNNALQVVEINRKLLGFSPNIFLGLQF